MKEEFGQRDRPWGTRCSLMFRFCQTKEEEIGKRKTWFLMSSWQCLHPPVNGLSNEYNPPK